MCTTLSELNMAFFCAGSSGQAKKKAKGSKPTAPPAARANNPFHDQPLPSIPHSNTSQDLPPNTRKMIVLQEYTPLDNRGLLVKRGESVQVISQDDGNWYFVRNERGKEGHVPSSHLVAPYSSMRTRSKSSGGLPLRSVASGSSLISHDMESSCCSSVRGSIPMVVSQSAGRPKELAGIGRPRGELTHVDTSGTQTPTNIQNDSHSLSLSQGAVAYDQKYSPSSSSGVASMNGPSSPSYQSLHQTPSQENVGHQSSDSSLTQERSSLSSGEDHEQLRYKHDVHIANGYIHKDGHVHVSDDMIGQNGEVHHKYKDETPPPVPPRNGPRQDPYNIDVYADPVDAVAQSDSYHANSFPEHQQVRSLNDIRMKVKMVSKENGEYSEVYQGGGVSRSKGQNGRHHPQYSYHSQDTESEGGSSRRSSSRRSGSTCKSVGRLQPGEMLREQDIRQAPPQMLQTPPPMLQSPQTKIAKFRKSAVWGVYKVTCEFEALDENEVSVYAGDHVSVLNQDDSEWYWVVRHTTAEEGFIPSCILDDTESGIEVVSTTHVSAEPVGGKSSVAVCAVPPPLPPKQPVHTSHGPSLYDHTNHFRKRAQSHDARSGASIVRRTPSDSRRGRLNSDGGSSVRSNHSPSATSVELRESPPPPYSEFDHHKPPLPPRQYSLSQKTPDIHSSGTTSYSNPIHRARSHGQVQNRGVHRTRPVERRGSDRMVSSPVVETPFQLRSPSTVTGGTLV